MQLTDFSRLHANAKNIQGVCYWADDLIARHKDNLSHFGSAAFHYCMRDDIKQHYDKPMLRYELWVDIRRIGYPDPEPCPWTGSKTRRWDDVSWSLGA